MGNASTLAEHSAQICVAALAFGSGAAGQLSAVPVSLAALFALGGTWVIKKKQACHLAAAQAVLEALSMSPEFAEEDLARASMLLPTSSRKVILDPLALNKGIEGGAADFDLYLARHLMTSIDLEFGDTKTRRLLEICLSTSVATCRRHPDIHRDLTQSLLLDAARDHGIQVSILNRVDANVKEILKRVEEMSEKMIVASTKKYVGNLYDFISYDPSPEKAAYVEIGVKKDGKAACFSNKSFSDSLKELHFLVNEQQITFVTKAWQIRAIGVQLNMEVASYILDTNRILMITLDEATGEAVEGYYLPLKVFK